MRSSSSTVLYSFVLYFSLGLHGSVQCVLQNIIELYLTVQYPDLTVNTIRSYDPSRSKPIFMRYKPLHVAELGPFLILPLATRQVRDRMP